MTYYQYAVQSSADIRTHHKELVTRIEGDNFKEWYTQNRFADGDR